jgi:hypothetical protein
MSRITRFLVGPVALATAVYATASLTGRWLGTPPWWNESVPVESLQKRIRALDSRARTDWESEWGAAHYAWTLQELEVTAGRLDETVRDLATEPRSDEATAMRSALSAAEEARRQPVLVSPFPIPRPHREAISVVVLLAGLGVFAAFGRAGMHPV